MDTAVKERLRLALTDREKIALGDFLLRRKEAGCEQVSAADIDTAIDAIRSAINTFPVRLQRGTN